jgi:hypothetical protein
MSWSQRLRVVTASDFDGANVREMDQSLDIQNDRFSVSSSHYAVIFGFTDDASGDRHDA